MKNTETKRGFTLIELLVVIAILATLAVAVTLVLNPAELVRQGRDSTRLSDLSALNSAMSLYLADQAEASFTASTTCTANGCSSLFDSETTNPGSMTAVTSTAVDGSGWVEVPFTDISSGAPISNLPLDPTNTTDSCAGDATSDGCYYIWAANSSEEYEFNTQMESTAFSNGGDDDVESDDGGTSDNVYEVGNDPGLDVIAS